MSNAQFGIPLRRQGLRLLPLFAVAAIWGCSASTVIPESLEERTSGAPLTRSPNLRIGSLTYRLGQLERTEEGLRIDFTLQNGSSRNIEQGLLRIILLGTQHEEMSAKLPFVGLRAGTSRALVARFADVPFRVQDLALEVIFVVP